MKISVIIPTYKPQNYLWECLDSIVSQTFSKADFEVIIVLNGCAEPYKSAIEKYIAEKMQGMNVNFIYTEVVGVSNARNLALDSAIGEYITFIDDDDYVSSCYLEELLGVASADTISLCYPLSFEDGTSVYNPFYITNDFLPSYINRQCHWYKARRYFNGPVYKLIHRKIIDNRRFDSRFTHGEDSLFMFHISNKFKWISFTPQNAVYYRRYRVGSAMTTKRSFLNKLYNEWKLFCVKTAIIIKKPVGYSFKFYIRNIVSGVVSIIIKQG